MDDLNEAGFRGISVTDPGVTHRMQVPGDWRRPDADGVYDIYWRSTDKFGQILPRPDLAEVPSFYAVADYYTHHNRRLDTGKHRGFLARLLHHLSWRLDRGVEPTDAWLSASVGDVAKDCLEIGCGKGEVLLRLRAMGHRVAGIEPDENGRAVSDAAGLMVHEGTVENIPAALRGSQFDVVIMLHVLEHCLDPVAALASAATLTRPGGRLIVEVPNNAAAGAELLGPAWYWLDVPRHLNFFSRQSLVRAVESAGFRTENVEYFGYNRQFSAEWGRMHSEISRILSIPRAGVTRQLLQLFLKTAFSGPDRRYDSIRIFALKPE